MLINVDLVARKCARTVDQFVRIRHVRREFNPLSCETGRGANGLFSCIGPKPTASPLGPLAADHI